MKKYQPRYCFMCQPQQVFSSAKQLHEHMRQKHQATSPFARQEDIPISTDITPDSGNQAP
jgi:hypothetical protein